MRITLSSTLILFLALFSMGFSQTCTLKVNLTDGTQIIYEVSEINRIDFEQITGIEDSEKMLNLINSFKLLKNYPNPFNPSTHIMYNIPRPGQVSIKILNMSGQLVKQIDIQNQKAGDHQVLWDGLTRSGLRAASGIYIYIVQFENRILSNKMMLLK